MTDLFENPAGLDGFEFIEFSAPEKGVLEPVFETMGFTKIARHRSKDVELWRQGGINLITNYEPKSPAWYFSREHGPSACGMGFRVKDASKAYAHLLAQGAEPVEMTTGVMELNIPGVRGIGNSIIYLIDRYETGDEASGLSIYDIDFEYLEGVDLEEFLREFNGEGIQHIALICDDLIACWDKLKANGVPFMTAPPETYYKMLSERLPGHGQDEAGLKTRGILLDGTTENGQPRLLLQIFAEPQVGPVFFEFIQRVGDYKDGFGEGNFKALFESIERDQIERGVLETEDA